MPQFESKVPTGRRQNAVFPSQIGGAACRAGASKTGGFHGPKLL